MYSNVCAGIVTFNPDMKKFKENLDSIIFQVDKVFVVDNASINIEACKNLVSSYRDKVSLLCNGENYGIAKALNQLCQKATEAEYEWILTLDQDSVSPLGLICSLYKEIVPNVGIIAPNIIYRNNEQYLQN